MVCKHKSEWSYDVDKIKQDTKAYFEKIKNHFKQEYEPQKGKTEAENENLSKHLDNLLESVLLKAKGLYFWDEQFAKKTGLPADGVVWHFEPFAWVEQMKRVFSVSKWRNPIDNAMLCLYTQNGNYKPWHGSFGDKIRVGNKTPIHTGIDLLAVPGTPVYACLKSKVDRIYTSKSLAGHCVVLEVLDKEIFKLMKRDYTPKYANKGEMLQQNFDEDNKVYLVFWHLSKNDFFKAGDIVEPNDIIGLTGVSGENGKDFETCNPHLHFEITNGGSTRGLNRKTNPCVYFVFKTEDDLTKEEIEYQKKLKDKNNW